MELARLPRGILDKILSFLCDSDWFQTQLASRLFLQKPVPGWRRGTLEVTRIGLKIERIFRRVVYERRVCILGHRRCDREELKSLLTCWNPTELVFVDLGSLNTRFNVVGFRCSDDRQSYIDKLYRKFGSRVFETFQTFRQVLIAISKNYGYLFLDMDHNRLYYVRLQ